MNTLRAGQPRNPGSFQGKGKNIALPRFARLALGPIQSPLQWLMEISGQGMKLTAHLNLAPRSRVHGAISLLFPRPSCLVQGLYLFLHSMWHTLPLFVLQFTSWVILRLPIPAALRHYNFPVGNYVTCIQNCNNIFVLSLIECRISGNAPYGDQDGWSGLSQTLDEIPYNLSTR
jgi:hypothetical protein